MPFVLPLHGRPDDHGFSLIEVLVATVIATVAVVGLAYTFGIGRSTIDRFETARAALATAQGRLEMLTTLSSGSPELSQGLHTADFVIGGEVRGQERWTVSWYDDAADGLDPADPNPNDLRRVTVEVLWTQGALTDTVRLVRLLPAS